MSDHFCNKSLKIEEAKLEYLPPEILIEIVLRLPIKSIITWTSVSKSWNSLIKNPNFISTHLNNHNRNQLLLLRRFETNHKKKFVQPLWARGESLLNEVFSLRWDNEAFDEYTRFDFPFHGLFDNRDFFHVVGTCNGLVCLYNKYNFCVWNPRIRKYVTGVVDMLGGFFGFGFDSKTNDYKVVKVMTFGNKKSPPKVDVYSLATGKWKMVTAVPPTCYVTAYWRHAFVNGALHWAVLGPTNEGFHNFVLAFDLADEDFREIMLPNDLLIKDVSSHLSVSVCGESLAVFCKMTSVSCIHVWVMKEYGILESWTKVITLDSLGPGVEFRFFDGLGFRKSGEVLIETYDTYVKLFSVDTVNKKIKDLRICTISGFSVNPYVESLVLLNKSEDAVSY